MGRSVTPWDGSVVESPELPAPRVDAIIVNWNGARYLPACVAALKRSSTPGRILLVDNASSDGSVEYIRQAHPDVDVLRLPENVGYAAGANAGLRMTGGEFAMILNPDVLLASDHLETLQQRLDEDASIGAAQGRLHQIQSEDFVAERVRSDGRLDSAGHSIHRSRMVVDRGQGREDGPEFHQEVSIFSACGAALFLRRSMLEDVAQDGEYFAESFFAYKEDIDLCWRARQLGWDVRYVPDAVAHHVRAAPLAADAWRRMPLAARRHSWKNHYLLMIRNDSAADIVRALPFIAAWELVRLGHALLRDPRVLTAYVDLARAVPAALRARSALLRRRRATPVAMRRWFGAAPRPIEAVVRTGVTAARRSAE
jgi:GT2 family glycosyltransferase